jgi:hypothetical protein
MSQTSYAQRFVTAIAGQLSCPLQDAVLDSKINALAMPAGVFVTRDAADDAVKVPAAAGDVTTTGCGFVKHDMAKERQQSQTVDFPAKNGVTVMRRGRMWVLSETASTFGAQVFVRITASGGNTQLGKVRNDADTATATALPGCRFIRTLAAGLTEIEYFGPGTPDAT